MQKHASRTGVGRHRKQSASPTTKGRVALVAVATGAASTAGAGGVAVAQAQHTETAEAPKIELAANATAPTSSEAPQILAIADFKPMANLNDQVSKAIKYNEERVAADNAARAPQTAKPAEGAFTSGFGPRWGSFHSGIDIANAVGTPILAVMDGTVIDSGPASGYGNWIRIKHEDGSISVYGHMESLDVSVGQHVTAGQKIAGMGNRGFSTGSHLHFEIHPNGQGAVDPVPWLAQRGISV
ncbi:M23 family metallopeptidase [Staphylococcus chromogenes]|nr:M23 family metallopeptidase [Staphylococcus chromogenes]